jgi:predicted metal-dependent hydrolase
VIDYVIVHELAHLNERNHSPRFWARVRAMQPDYPARLQWLKDNGHKLFV